MARPQFGVSSAAPHLVHQSYLREPTPDFHLWNSSASYLSTGHVLTTCIASHASTNPPVQHCAHTSMTPWPRVCHAHDRPGYCSPRHVSILLTLLIRAVRSPTARARKTGCSVPARVRGSWCCCEMGLAKLRSAPSKRLALGGTVRRLSI